MLAGAAMRAGKHLMAFAHASYVLTLTKGRHSASSTLIVSIFYLIPQMVGAGALVQPLLGLPHWIGVLLVGVVVTLIVVTAGMVSTTWVQFIKGSLLVLFCALLTVAILARGFKTIDETGATLFTIDLVDDGCESMPYDLNPCLLRMRTDEPPPGWGEE